MTSEPHRAPRTPKVAAADNFALRDVLTWVAPQLRAHRLRIAAALGLLLAAKVATVTVPSILKALVDGLSIDAPPVVAAPAALLLAYGGLRVAASAFRELQSAVFERVRAGIVRNMARQVVEHLHGLSLRFHLERKTGELARDIDRGTSSVSTLLNHLLFNIVPTLVEVALVASILSAQYDVRYALVTAATVAVYVALTFGITQWRLKYRLETNRLESEASSRAIDGLLNYETVKYFGNEAFELHRYDDSLRRWQDVAVRSQGSLSLLNAAQGATIAAGVTAIMWMAARGVQDGTLTVGDLVAVNAYMLQLFAPLGFLGTIYSMLKHAIADMERMAALLRRVPEIQPPVAPLGAESVRGDVRFDDVRFAYDPERPILHGVSIHAPAGTKVAIVGASGSGKSTLARLLFRFYDVTGGAVTIDGVDVRSLEPGALRRSIGIVPQDTVLFNDTLRFNLRYARLDATDADVDEAVRAAQLDRFVATLPAGLETVVGERGLKLSGGEKQRVAIARAILKAPPILVFDEATSSLDSTAEQAILEALRRIEGNRTTLVIAHRLSTVVDADEIVVMDSGRVVERGTHAALLAAAGVYAHMWALQQAEQEGDGVLP